MTVSRYPPPTNPAQCKHLPLRVRARIGGELGIGLGFRGKEFEFGIMV